MPRLVLHDIEYRFDGESSPLLRDVELDTSGASRIGIVGPSGIGKTTLFELISGKRSPTKGSITVDGRPNSEATIAYCYQDRRLVPWLSVRENIQYGLPEMRHSKLVDEMIERLDLGRVAHIPARKVSGGEQARCAIGRAVISEPELLLLDEPLSGLDQRVRDQVIDSLLTLQRERQFLLVLISHEMNDIETLCEQVHVLAGDPAQFIRSVSLTAQLGSQERSALIDSIAQIIAS